MLKKVLGSSLLIALGIAVGLWLGRVSSAQATGKGMVYEMRTYYTNEGKLPDLQARFRNHTTKLFEKHGMKNIGYWVPQDAPASQNMLIYIIAHQDREAAKKSWSAFANDPEWKKVRDASEVNGKIVSKVDSVFMEATDYSPIK
jgi:hypothetical protein